MLVTLLKDIAMEKLTIEQCKHLIHMINDLPKHAYDNGEDIVPDIGVNVVDVLSVIYGYREGCNG